MIRNCTISDLNINIIPQTENYITRHDHSYDSFAGSGESSIVSYEFQQELYYLTCSPSTLPFRSDILFLYNSLLLQHISLLNVYTLMLHVYIRTLPLYNHMLNVYNRTLPLYNRMLNICIKAFSTAQNNYTIRRKKISILLYINLLKTTDQILRSIQQWIFNPFSVSKPVFLPINYYLQCRCRTYLQIVTTYKIYIVESINVVYETYFFTLKFFYL